MLTGTWDIRQGDCRIVLRNLAAETIHLGIRLAALFTFALSRQHNAECLAFRIPPPQRAGLLSAAR